MAVIFDALTGQLLNLPGAGGSAPVIPASRYTLDFNSTTSWALVSGFYELLIASATHTKGLNPNVLILELEFGVYSQVTTDQCATDTLGNVTIKTLATPDLRFAGRIIII